MMSDIDQWYNKGGTSGRTDGPDCRLGSDAGHRQVIHHRESVTPARSGNGLRKKDVCSVSVALSVPKRR